MSPTTAGTTVSEMALPNPWKHRIASKEAKLDVKDPHIEATKRVKVDKIMIGRRPNTLAKGTKIMLPSPKTSTLN